MKIEIAKVLTHATGCCIEVGTWNRYLEGSVPIGGILHYSNAAGGGSGQAT